MFGHMTVSLHRIRRFELAVKFDLQAAEMSNPFPIFVARDSLRQVAAQPSKVLLSRIFLHERIANCDAHSTRLRPSTKHWYTWKGRRKAS